MASTLSKVFLLLFLFSSMIHFHFAFGALYEVNGDGGWRVPKHDDKQFYNKWASRNRFKVDDIIHFKYKKDSVLVVSEAEYEKCEAPSHPQFFSNSGHTSFKLNRTGSFYFISGVQGHCKEGQKMIIKVLETPSLPPQSPAKNNQTNSPVNKKNSAVQIGAVTSLTTVLLLLSAFGVASF